MKFSGVIVLSVITIVCTSMADDSTSTIPYYGELQDYVGSTIVKIETHYDHQDPAPGTPPRRSTCVTEEISKANASCGEICVGRSHKGGSCKESICLCAD